MLAKPRMLFVEKGVVTTFGRSSAGYLPAAELDGKARMRTREDCRLFARACGYVAEFREYGAPVPPPEQLAKLDRRLEVHQLALAEMAAKLKDLAPAAHAAIVEVIDKLDATSDAINDAIDAINESTMERAA